MSEDKKFRSGFAALLGRPNVGKSSIINALLKEKVAAVSPKPQTTRNAVRCIYTSEDEQIVFVDTPGIHVPQHALGDFMMKEAEESLMLVDAVCYVVEAQDRAVSEKDEIILKVLENVSQPVVLAVNKIDKLADFEDYKKAAAVYEKYIKPAAVVPVSANNRRGLDEARGGDQRPAAGAAADLSRGYADGFDRALSRLGGHPREDIPPHQRRGPPRSGRDHRRVQESRRVSR